MSSSSLSTIIQAEQSNTFFLLLVLIKEGTPFMKEIYSHGTRLTAPNESLIERIKKKNNISNNVFKGKFNKAARDKMENDNFMDFDISLWYLILQHDCDELAPPDDAAWSTPGTLEEHLKSIKDFRNEIMHSEFSISDAEFHPKLEELRYLLVETAKLVKSRFSLDQVTVDRFINSFNDTINTIRDEPWEQIDLTSYGGTHLFNTLKSVLERDGINDLREMFKKKFSYVNPAALIARRDIPIEVMQIFTPLQIIEEVEKHTPKNVTICQKVALDDILQIAHNHNKEIILLEGIAGVGKTTIMQKLMLEWAGRSTIKDLYRYHYIIPVQCRDRGYDSLERLVNALMPTARQIFREDKHMMDFLFKFPTLFLFDGADEMTDESKKILTEFLGMTMKRSLCIISTRPQKIQEIRHLISNRAKVLQLRVKGIAEEKREAFIVKYHKSLQDLNVTSQNNADGLLSYLRTTGVHLQEFWSLPINLALVTLLWGIDSDCVRSITCPIELMIQIQNRSIARLKERLINKRFPLKDLDKKISEFVSLLSKIALIGIRDSNLMIPQSGIRRLEEKCANLNLPSEELLGAFLLRKTSWSGAVISYFSFPHKSGQEFYAATAIHNQVFDKQTDDEAELCRIHTFLKRKGADSYTLKGVEKLIKREKGKGKTVTEVLKEIEREIGHPSPSMAKYQDTLTYLLGLLHHYKSLTTKDSATDIISLLKQAGVKRKEDWISLLNGVKCDPIVAKTLIERHRIIVKDVSIRDVNVFAHSTLLQEKIPERLDIHITGKPSEIALLDDLMKLIAEKEIPITYLCFDYHFKYENKHSVNSVLQVLRRCPVKERYRGRFPSGGGGGGDSHPPTWLQETEYLNVSLTQPEEAESFFDFLQERERLNRPLWDLVLSIGRHVTPDVIRSIPSGLVQGNINVFIPVPDDDKGAIIVFLPDTEDDEGGRQRVGDILRNLNIKLFEQLCFPRYHQNHIEASSSSSSSGIWNLLESLQGIKVRWSISFPLICRPEKEEEEKRLQEMCKTILGCDDGIVWGGSVDDGDIWNMDSWE